MKNNGGLMVQLCRVLACGMAACGSAHAAITCNVSSNGFSSAYVPSNPGINITSGSVTMTCTRTLASDATSQAYTVRANNGINPSGGGQNNAGSGANLILYDNYVDGSCGTQWKGGVRLGGTINFTSANDFTPQSQTEPFWGCIPAGQIAVPAGTYTDIVTMTPSIGVPATLQVTIITPSSCSITTPPGNVTFNYTAFQGLPSSATSNFAATCTKLLPYTMALDAPSSVLTGLNYNLSLSATSSVGTGAAQNYTINGVMAAGQAGTCATGVCSATEARTLTITY